jgi:hypothetical protein
MKLELSSRITPVDAGTDIKEVRVAKKKLSRVAVWNCTCTQRTCAVGWGGGWRISTSRLYPIDVDETPIFIKMFHFRQLQP